jgi:hypothetical protein
LKFSYSDQPVKKFKLSDPVRQEPCLGAIFAPHCCGTIDSCRNEAMKEPVMPFVYPRVNELTGKAAVGNAECVAIVKELVPGLIGVTTQQWKEGKAVKDVPDLARGTAIATFFNGKFPRMNTCGWHISKCQQ